MLSVIRVCPARPDDAVAADPRSHGERNCQVAQARRNRLRDMSSGVATQRPIIICATFYLLVKNVKADRKRNH